METVSKYGDSGVDLFFVLSGFLITSILLRERLSKNYYRDFYWKRLLRIGPVLFVALLVTVCLGQYKYALIAAAFLGNFSLHWGASGTAPFWTLAIEEQFYLLWPTVIRRLAPARVRFAAVAIAVMSVALRYVNSLHGHTHFRFTPLRLDTLALGALLAVLVSEQRSLAWFSRVIAGMFVAGLGCLSAGFVYSGVLMPATHALGVSLVAASCVWASVSFSGKSWLAPLRSRGLLFFAQISYALYLFHLFVFRAYDGHVSLPAVGDYFSYWIRLAVLFAASVALAVISRYALELPILNLRTKVLSHPQLHRREPAPSMPIGQM